MSYYEIYCIHGAYEVWKWTGDGLHGERVKCYKTKKAAESWAAKQWARVIWR